MTAIFYTGDQTVVRELGFWGLEIEQRSVVLNKTQPSFAIILLRPFETF